MSIRTKFALIFLGFILVPLIAVSFVTFEMEKQDLRENLGTSFMGMASETITEVDRALLDVRKDVQMWAGLELMQEVLTGDLDGRISSFLMTLSKEYGVYTGIDVVDGAGVVVASSNPEAIGRAQKGEGFFEAAIEGSPYMSDVQVDELSGLPIVLVSWPIRAPFGGGQSIGVLVARWDIDELRKMTRPAPEQSENTTVVLITKKGRVISENSAEAPRLLGENLIERGWDSALLASRGERGYRVEIPKDETYLIGYSRSAGYDEFLGLGWSALVIQDLDSAFSSINELRYLMLVAGAIVTLAVIVLSFVVSHRVTSPLVQMAHAAERVSSGDFDIQVGYRAGDELGVLAQVFDRMIRELKNQRARLEEDIAFRERTESELRTAMESAEESTKRLAAVLDTMGEGVVTLDTRGRILTANREALNIWGLSNEELIGQNVEMLIPAEYLDGHQTGFRRYIAREDPNAPKVRLMAEGTRKNGERFPLEVTITSAQITGKWILTAAVRDITEQQRAQEQIKASLVEKEALLQEIHHRVKNNLQVIVSLLDLQSGYIQGEKAYGVFKDSESRVKSMALIHEKLYGSKDLSKIDAAEYLRSLTGDLLAFYRMDASGIVLNVDVENLGVGMDTAINCGLIVNELVSNALKYAFPEGREGEVEISFHKLATAEHVLMVKDNGVGLPADLRVPSPKTLGLQLVFTLADQLEGTVEVDRSEGTAFKIVFKNIES